jgi:hypothetical protein
MSCEWKEKGGGQSKRRRMRKTGEGGRIPNEFTNAQRAEVNARGKLKDPGCVHKVDARRGELQVLVIILSKILNGEFCHFGWA